jgi:hypothetical protein
MAVCWVLGDALLEWRWPVVREVAGETETPFALHQFFVEPVELGVNVCAAVPVGGRTD